MKKLTAKEDISNLLSNSVFSMALGAAIETGPIQMLAEKPMTGEEVSLVMNNPDKRCHYWLQHLIELGVLEMDSQGYVLSPVMRAVISDNIMLDRWKHVAPDERERLAGLRNLAIYLSEPGSIWEVQGLANPNNDYEKMIDDPERAHVFTRLLYNFYRDSKDELSDLIDMTGIERMMDVGGGSVIASILLAQKYPNLASVVVDLEYVCTEGIKIVEENHLSDRIAFHGANFLPDELPKDFDMMLYCDIGVFGERLFRKLREALKPDGRIVVVFHFPTSENFAPEPYLKWAFLDSLEVPNFGFPIVAQVQAQLVQAGFRILPEEYVLSEGQIVIQAQKAEE